MTGTLPSVDAHRERHRYLHRAVDELVQDYVAHHPAEIGTIRTLTVGDLLAWAAAEAVEPTEPYGEQHPDA